MDVSKWGYHGDKTERKDQLLRNPAADHRGHALGPYKDRTAPTRRVPRQFSNAKTISGSSFVTPDGLV